MAKEPKDLWYKRTGELARLRKELQKAIADGNDKREAEIRQQMENINKDKPSAGKGMTKKNSKLTVG